MSSMYRWLPWLVVRCLPATVCLLGLVVLCYATAVGCGASLPYPDPTPELLSHQQDDIQAAERLALVGAGIAAAGAVGWIGCWLFGRRRPSVG